MTSKEIEVNGKLFRCPVTATVDNAVANIRSRFGLVHGGLEDENGALMHGDQTIGSTCGSLSFVDGRPAHQGS
jgi:hypothetical protein